MFLSVWVLVIGGSWGISVGPSAYGVYAVIGLLLWLMVVMVFACRKAEDSGDELLIAGILGIILLFLPLVAIGEFFGWGEPILKSMTWFGDDDSESSDD